MEYVVICPTKLKVVMSREEAESFGIKATNGEYDSASVRGALGEILSMAEKDVGFSVGEEQVLIQLYPTNKGGCEMFVTRLSTLSEKERRSLVEHDCLNTYKGRESIYMFSSLKDLCDSARAIKKHSCEWDVYLSDKGEYYVVFREHTIDGFSDFDILSEYAERKRRLPPEIIGERGRLLCRGNGIEIFSKL